MVAAACRDTAAERGEPEGDSPRGSASPLVAMMLMKRDWVSGRVSAIVEVV